MIFMSRFFRLLGVGLLVAIGIVAILGITLVLYNFEDDELDPQVARLLMETPRQIPAGDNGYFAWIGVVGPDAVEPHEWGRRWFEEALAADRERRPPPLAIEAEIEPDQLRVDGIPCDKIEKCLDEVSERPADVHGVLEQAMGMLSRCDAAMDYANYQEPWRPRLGFSSSFPRYSFVCRDLQATRFALAAAEARDEEALGYLDKEIDFHIRQMRGAVTLLDKMVSISYLHWDYLLVNQYLLRRPDAASLHIERLGKMLATLDANASSMAAVLKTEWQLVARGFLELPNMASSMDEADGGLWVEQGGLIDRAVTGLFYLPNATVNEYYRWYVPIANLEKLSGESYRRAITAIESNQATDRDAGIFGLTLRNPAGCILTLIGQPAFLSYINVSDDLLALRAAVEFQLELLSRGVTDEDAIKQAVAAAKLVHRFTGEVAIWDKESRTLVYSAPPQGDGKPLAIRL